MSEPKIITDLLVGQEFYSKIEKGFDVAEMPTGYRGLKVMAQPYWPEHLIGLAQNGEIVDVIDLREKCDDRR